VRNLCRIAPIFIAIALPLLTTGCTTASRLARVTFSGQPLGHGMVLLPNRLTWTAQ